MAKPLVTFDTSVMVAAVTKTEPSHGEANDFLQRLQAASATGKVSIGAPVMFFFEIFAVLGRRDPKTHDGHLVGFLSFESPLAVGHLDLDHDDSAAFIGKHSAKVGPKPFVNGADLMWVAAATKYDSTLVTLDVGMLKYNGVLCRVLKPNEWAPPT